MKVRAVNHGISQALLAAVLFGASVPLAKILLGTVDPILLAGLLYLSSGIGLLLWRGVRDRFLPNEAEASITPRDLPWLVGATVLGGMAGPVLLMWGLQRTPAASASLLLNLEGVFTIGLAWWVFHEHFDRRIAFGAFSVLLGGILLSWHGPMNLAPSFGPAAIAAACLCWAIENNLTRHIAGGDPAQIAGIKSMVAGVVNLTIALLLGAHLPAWPFIVGASAVGLLGYGASLVLFILALRHLGAARTSAYFGAAPFVGAGLSLLLLAEPVPFLFWPALALMLFGLWIHLTERHNHLHVHEPLAHTHRHVHDEHHQHVHEFPWDGSEPHTHYHVHPRMVHRHPHFPDLHHSHRHG